METMDTILLTVPKVLFIHGVKKSDCVTDDFFVKRDILADVAEEESAEFDQLEAIANGEYIRPHTPLPRFFTSFAEWPETSNLMCWYCHLYFDDVPLFIPSSIEPQVVQTRDRLSFGVYGVFCSFGCAHAFIDTSDHSLLRKIQERTKINFLYKTRFGRADTMSYNEYPDPYDMVQYGGDLDVDVFCAQKKTFQLL